MDTARRISCISIEHKTAPEPFRARLSFSEEEKAALLYSLKEAGAFGVILCTCCRTELYHTADEETGISLLAERAGMSSQELLSRAGLFSDERAIRHLFRVASGLRSAILGEDEILRQVKKAYEHSVSAGGVCCELNRIFQAAIACGKRVRCDTAISQIPVSSATLAANAAAGFGEKVRVLVIGASGETGSSVLKNLLGHKNVTAAATQRSCGGKVISDSRCRVIPYKDRYEAIDESDCIISATASPHRTVTLYELKKRCISGRKLFIDMAVPADIDRDIGCIDGFTRMDIDELHSLAEQNGLLRQSRAEAAEQITAEEVERVSKELIYHSAADEIASAVRLMQKSPEAALHRLKKQLSSSELRHVLDVLGGN